MRRTTAERLAALLGPTPLTYPRYADLANRLRLLIIDGRLTHDTRLPGERDLAAALGSSRVTVASAYQRLRDEGHLVSRRGAGHDVVLPDAPIERALPDPFPRDGGVIGLSTAATAPPPQLASLLTGLTERLSALGQTSGYHPDGLPELRARLADSYTRRGLPTEPEQMIITNGALSALHLITRHLAHGRDRILLEETSYSNAIEGLRRQGFRPYGFALSDTGWDLDALRAGLADAATVTYVIADFHNPTGRMVGSAERAALGAVTRRSRTRLVIDETMLEVNLDGIAVPEPVACHDPTAITIGSASKSFWGGLRIGWIRAPRDLVRGLVETRSLLDLSSPILDQLLVSDMVGDPTAVLDHQRRVHRHRRDHLVRLLTERLPTWEFEVPPGGLSLWVTLPRPASGQLVVAAERRGVVLTAGPRFHTESGGDRHLRLPYVAEPETLTRAIDVLADVWPTVDTEISAQRTPRSRLSA
ncbi:MAG: PLP-dependent aminotransferase family protein [Propionibacteriales bacterium]|nr:PLP-dependent aminotransferase family protein [Propionibacteriales bacterium]